MSKICSVYNCKNQAICKRLCNKHYTRLQRNGHPLRLILKEKRKLPKRKCSVNGCNKIHYGLGFCCNHYYHLKKYGDPLACANKDETREKMRIAKLKNPSRYWLGKKRKVTWITGHPAWNKGLKGFMAMEKNSQWRGGLSFEPYSPEFNDELKLVIRNRDNHTCQECGFTEEQLGYTLSVHHIDYDKKNSKPDNLISLCKNCHQQTSFDRNDWINYLKEKMVEKCLMK